MSWFVDCDCEAELPCSGRSVETMTVLPPPPEPEPAADDVAALSDLLAQAVSAKAAAAVTATSRVILRVCNAPPQERRRLLLATIGRAVLPLVPDGSGTTVPRRS